MIALYLFFGPIVLLLLYIGFDRLAEKVPAPPQAGLRDSMKKKEALWTGQDAESFLEKKRGGKKVDHC